MKRVWVMVCVGLMAVMMAAGCSTGDASPKPVVVEPSAQAGGVMQENVPSPSVSEPEVVESGVSSEPVQDKEKVEEPAAAAAPAVQTKPDTVSVVAKQRPNVAVPAQQTSQPAQTQQTQQTYWSGHHGNHHYGGGHHGRQNGAGVCGTCHGNRICPSCNGSGCPYCTGTNGNCWVCGGTGQAS